MSGARTHQQSVVPEDRTAAQEVLGLDLSREDGPMLPVERGTPGWFSDCPPVEQILSDFMRTIVGENGRVLLFEPTRPDIRRAVLSAGLSYIDGGRLLNGPPDPATLAYVLQEKIQLVVCESGELEGLPGRPLLLVDRRSTPFYGTSFHTGVTENRFELVQLGPRDGFQHESARWVRGPDGTQYTGWSPTQRQLNELFTPPFKQRASERFAAQEGWLNRFADISVGAGFEAMILGGFLWLGWPGLPSEEIRRNFLNHGITVFSVEHHPYRHRVRLCPVHPGNDPIITEALRNTSRSLKLSEVNRA
jgi:hypothetical protein